MSTQADEAANSTLIRLPSLERGCKGKINLGHKRYAYNAERMSRKFGKQYAVYLCPYCKGTHLTTKLDKQYATQVLYFTQTTVSTTAADLPPPPPQS